MKSYEMYNMIIDDDFTGEEYVTTEFTYDHHMYSITFRKADLEMINTWIYKDGTSLPADLSHELIESIREEVKKKIE